MLLVLGKSGQLGQAVQNSSLADNAVFLGSDECDVTDQTQITKVLDECKPTAVLNCAAYTDVRKAETEEKDVAFLVNGTAVKYLAKETASRDIPLIHISTDYVFDGTADTPYEVDAPTNPLNEYAKSKLAGEEAFNEFAKCGALLRVSHLSSKYGNNIVKTFAKLLSSLEEMNVVEDQRVTLTTTDDVIACIRLLLESDALYKEKSLYHVGSSDSMSFMELAKEVATYVDSETKITPVTLDSFGDALKRPLYSVLDVSGSSDLHYQCSWKKSVENILK